VIDITGYGGNASQIHFISGVRSFILQPEMRARLRAQAIRG